MPVALEKDRWKWRREYNSGTGRRRGRGYDQAIKLLNNLMVKNNFCSAEQDMN